MPDADLSQGLERLLSDADIWRPRIVITAAELDIFSVLARRIDEPAALAAEVDAAPEAMLRLLCALQEMGYVESENGRFRNTEVSTTFLVRGSPCYLGSWLILQAGDWPAWGGLTDMIRSGRPPAAGSVFADPRRLRVLLNAAHERARLFHVDPLLSVIDISGVSTLLDVGAGAGTYSIAFCEAYPELQCTLFDLPAALEVAREVLRPYSVSSRISLRPGDFMRDDFGGPYDAAFLSNVLHGEPPRAAGTLVARLRQVLRPGGRLFIRDSFLGEDGTNALNGAVFGLTLMIETTAGRTHRFTDVEEMLRNAGFDRLERLAPELLVGWAPRRHEAGGP